jgi:hypothetical protein
MKVCVVTAWAYREPLAPYFCQHYAWADEIIALVGPFKWEGASYPGVEIREVPYRDNLFCEFQKRDHLNAAIREIQTDWILCVDADEFVFAMDPQGQPMEDLRPFLETITDGNVVYCDLWDVYRHMTDKDLDPNEPPLLQRRHGEREIDFLYQKPIVFRPESEIRFHSGQHRYFENPNIRVSKRRLHGSHWKYADVTIAVQRQAIRDKLIRPLQKQPPVNIQALCSRHMADEQLF